MARPFWKGAISFGMVVIPVKMYTATETKGLTFRVEMALSGSGLGRHCPPGGISGRPAFGVESA
jgi:hypothetical protein